MSGGDNWYPKARIFYSERMKTRGKYAGGYPKGAVIHYTAGNFDRGYKSAEQTIKGGIKKGFAFMCIARTGEVLQAHPITEWGYHCGKSAWRKVAEPLRLVGGLNDDCIGIEMCNAGKLEKRDGRFFTYWGLEVPVSDVRYVTYEQWECQTGYYHKYSLAQEQSLIELLLWLKANDPGDNFSFDHVVGHHEISGLLELGAWRKNDPGGSLSVPMSKFRMMLKDVYAKYSQRISP